MSEELEPRTESFGDVLREFMANKRNGQRRWNAETLGSHLGVDRSLVSKWLSGNVLPASNATYVAELVEILPLDAGERKRLNAAYEWSRAVRVYNKRGTYQSVGQGIADLVRESPPAPLAFAASSLPPELANAKLPSESEVIRGADQLGRVAIALMTHAPEILPHTGTIYMTYNGARNFLPDASTLNQLWQLSVRQALQRGWDVCEILRLNHDPRRSLALVDTFRMHLGTKGTYIPYYVRSSGTLDVPEGILAVPGVGALILFATKQSEKVDSAIYIPATASGRDIPATASGGDRIALLIEHIERFRLTPGILEPLLRAYPPTGDGGLAFYEKLDAHEARHGDIFTLMRGMPVSARPLSFMNPGSTLLDSWPREEVERWAAITRRRITTLREQLAANSGSVRVVCSLQAVTEFVERGAHAKDVYYGTSKRAELKPYTPQERFDQVRYIRSLLCAHANYEWALFDEAKHPDLAESFFWEVIGDRAAMLETWRPADDGEAEEIDLEITEPKIVSAFHAYGRAIWSRVLPPQAHEKTWVIARLDEYLAWLKAHHGDEIIDPSA